MQHQNRLTNEAEDVTNVGHEDDKKVDSKEQTYGDEDVTHPVKGLIRKHKLKDSTADLREEEQANTKTHQSTIDCPTCISM